MFGHLLVWYTIYTFWRLLPLTEFCHQVLHSPILTTLLHDTRAVGISQTLRHGTRNGIAELSQRAPPIFDWVSITLGIGPHSSFSFFGRPFVKLFSLCYQTVVCLSVLSCSVCPVCRQTVGWIKVKLGREVDLSFSDIVLDGDPAPLPKKSRTAPADFRPTSIVARRWMDEDVTWYGSIPLPRHVVRRGPSSPFPKGAEPP